MLLFVTGCPLVPTPTACTTDEECADTNACTTDACTDGACTNTAIECAEGETCVDGACTLVCAEDSECDDGDGCTTDTCTDSACSHADVDCDDGDNCTTDSCDSATGACSNDAVDCGTSQTCDAATGECVDIPCEADADCTDGDLCTDDTCVDGACAYTDMDCDDGDLCTTDSCTDGVCANDAVTCPDGSSCDADTGECVEATCTEDANCDDGLFCNGSETCDTTTGLCVDGTDPCADTTCTCAGEAQDPVCAEGDSAASCSCPDCPEIEFTLGQDSLSGSTGDDIFTAPLEFNSASGSQVATLQTGDSANGLAGTDVLSASFNTSSTVVPSTIADIETINITNFASGTLTLSATNISGVSTINQVNSVNDLAVTGLQELADCGFSTINDTSVDLAMTFAQTSTTSGSADTFTCTLTDATVGTLTVTTNSTNGFETMALVSNGSTANQLTTLTQTTGTTMATATFTGAQNLTATIIPATILTIDASAMTGNLTLGAGTTNAAYAEFANPSSNFVSITGGSGDDTIIFEDTLATTDFTSGTLDLGAGTDVVQNSFGTTFGAASKLRNVEEMRLDATASGISVNFSGHTGLTTITNDQDGTANTLTLSNVPVTSTAGTWPTLNFRGNATQAAQTYDTITYSATGATGSSDKLPITVGNRGTALNATGTSNVHTMGAITAAGFETLTIDVTDGPGTFGGLTVTGLTSCTITGSSNVTAGTIAPASGVTVLTMDTSGVVGNFNGTFDYIADGASYTGGSGNDTVTFGTNSTATNTTVSLGNGNNTFVGDTNTQSIDTITCGSGNDTITGGPGGDTITVGGGSDIINLDNSDTNETSIDTVTDFTIGEDTITFDISSLEARDVNTGAADDMVDYGQVSAAAADAFTIEVFTADGATAGSAIDMAVISDTLATYADAAAYIAATSATVIWSGGVVVAGDIHLLAYEDGSNNTRVGLFTDLGGGGANTDAFDLGEDVLILSGVNAASLTSASFNAWQ